MAEGGLYGSRGASPVAQPKTPLQRALALGTHHQDLQQLALQKGGKEGGATHSIEGRAEVSDALHQRELVLQVLKPKKKEHSLNCGKGCGLQGGHVGATLREGLGSSSGHKPFPKGPLEREGPLKWVSPHVEGLQLGALTPWHALSSHLAAAAVQQQDVAHNVSLQAGKQLFLGGSQCQAAMGEDESAACGMSSHAVQLHLCGEKCLETLAQRPPVPRDAPGLPRQKLL